MENLIIVLVVCVAGVVWMMREAKKAADNNEPIAQLLVVFSVIAGICAICTLWELFPFIKPYIAAHVKNDW